jgi:hypothetical protein
VGEELSRAFYTRFGEPGDHLQRPVQLEVELDHQLGMCCRPEKRGGVSPLTFLFAPADFRFGDFLNLPYLFPPRVPVPSSHRTHVCRSVPETTYIPRQLRRWLADLHGL